MNLSKTTARNSLLAGTIAIAVAVATPLVLSPVAVNAENNATRQYHQLPSFRQLIKDNASAVVSIRGSRSLRPTANNAPPQLPEGMPESFRRFFEQMPRGP